MQSSRNFPTLICGPRSKDNTERVLNARKNSRGHIRLMTLGRAIDHPYVIAVAPQVLAHLLKPRAIQEAGSRNEANDPVPFAFRQSSCILPSGSKDLQRRP